MNPSLSDETIRASTEVAGLQDNANPTQSPLQQALYASKPITGLTLQLTHQSEIQSVTHEEACYTPK